MPRYQGGGRQSQKWAVETWTSSWPHGTVSQSTTIRFPDETNAREHFAECNVGLVRLWHGIDCIEVKDLRAI